MIEIGPNLSEAIQVAALFAFLGVFVYLLKTITTEKDNRMKLYAWQPRGYGQLSWFVLAETEDDAKILVEKEMVRRKALPMSNDDEISDYDCKGWGTDYYILTVVGPGTVLTNTNT